MAITSVGTAFALAKAPDTNLDCKKRLRHGAMEIRKELPYGLPKIKFGEKEGRTQIRFSYPRNVDSSVFLKSFGKDEQDEVEAHGHKNVHAFTLDHGQVLLEPSSNVWSDFAYYKEGPLEEKEVDAILNAYRMSWKDAEAVLAQQVKQNPPSEKDKAIAALEGMGIRVYCGEKDDLTWDSLAGYEELKREIQDTLVLALQNPALFDEIAKNTRCRFETNRPRAVLFEGPPGTGKTLCARIIARESGLPMIHIPVESVVSKWFGEAEKNLSQIIDTCSAFNGAIIFIDEVDALAGDRGSGNMHEASRRMLSVLLQKLEGFQESSNTTLVCATNRIQDIDPAMRSRFGTTLTFDLPSTPARHSIFKRYAKQLTNEELETLAHLTLGFSCRDIKESCEQAERKWASRILRNLETQKLPPLSIYEQVLSSKKSIQ